MLDNFIQNSGYEYKEECIGRGTDGYVTSITHLQTKKQYALKVVNLANPKSLDYFISEASIMMKLRKHENIISTKSFSVNQQKLEGYIIMEKLDTDLLRYILSKGRLSESESKRFFFQICSALAFSHNNQVAHLDLKPENILINLQTKKIKICDFFRSQQWSRNSMIKGGQEITTVEYRPPEVHTQSEYRIDLVDQWSAGIILFTMVTGSFPFGGHTPNKRNSYHVDISKFNDFLRNMGISSACHDLLSQLLSIDPNQRPSFSSILDHPFFTN